MDQSTKDKVEGRAHEIKGAAIEKTGELLGNKEMQADGAAERFDGKVQKNVGRVEEIVEDILQ